VMKQPEGAALRREIADYSPCLCRSTGGEGKTLPDESPGMPPADAIIADAGLTNLARPPRPGRASRSSCATTPSARWSLMSEGFVCVPIRAVS